MSLQLQEKLKKLREYYYDDDYSLKWIEETEKKIRRLVVNDALKENQSVIEIINDAKARINTINKLLVYKEDITVEERNKLYRERDVHQFYLDRFEGRNLDDRFEQIEKVLDEEISKIDKG